MEFRSELYHSILISESFFDSVFKSWLLYTRKKNNLRRLEHAFTRRRNQRLLEKYWYLVKTRFDYCVELSEMANTVVQEKNRELLRLALHHWDFRLKVYSTKKSKGS